MRKKEKKKEPTYVAIRQIEYSFDSEKSQMNILHPFEYTTNT